ncbi:hypothetical protein KRP22_000169 [Phytophthora ramorum]|nr:hypothetical protein KRP22_12115 [Phytophthora ramorum]
MAKNADICRVLFAALPDYYFKCKYCGTVRRQLPSSGYGNLMSHLKDKHAEYEADYLAHASSHAGTLHSFGFVNDKIANIYHWMEWVAGARGEELTPEELGALEPFELEAVAKPTPATSGSGVSTRSCNAAEDFATARLRSDAPTPQLSPRYSPIVTAILPTSNLCERLFSQCKLVMTPHRSSFLPVNFEMIVFLRANRKFWDANTLMSVDAAVADEN